MSLTSPLAAPANVGIPSARGLLRGGSLLSMARALGVVLGAGLLAASYQFAYEESRMVVHNIRIAGARRRARNDALMLLLLSSPLPIGLQEKLRRSRDAVNASMRLLTSPALPRDQHAIIHAALTRIISGELQRVD